MNCHLQLREFERAIQCAILLFKINVRLHGFGHFSTLEVLDGILPFLNLTQQYWMAQQLLVLFAELCGDLSFSYYLCLQRLCVLSQKLDRHEKCIEYLEHFLGI